MGASDCATSVLPSVAVIVVSSARARGIKDREGNKSNTARKIKKRRARVLVRFRFKSIDMKSPVVTIVSLNNVRLEMGIQTCSAMSSRNHCDL